MLVLAEHGVLTLLNMEWITAYCWVASFDILGFKGLIDIDENSMEAEFAQEDYERTLSHLKDIRGAYSTEALDYLWLSDTFVMFSPDDTYQSYGVIEQAARRFIEECIYSGIPIRGAISCGALIRSNDKRSLMGQAFVEAYIYGEDQDWLGLILSPSAIIKARSLDLEPTHHDFIYSDEIPMRNCCRKGVLAYRLQKGADSSIAPLLSSLEGMKQAAQSKHHPKYERTIDFLKKHARYAE